MANSEESDNGDEEGVIAFSDGGCEDINKPELENKPAYGILVKEDGETEYKDYDKINFSHPLVSDGTNHEAEYFGLIKLLEYLKKNYPEEVVSVRMDAELVVKQIRGDYDVKSNNLKSLYKRVQGLLEDVNVTLTEIPSEDNEAHELADKAIDEYYTEDESTNESDTSEGLTYSSAEEEADSDLWHNVVLETLTEDGFPHTSFHSHARELEQLAEELREEINRIEEETDTTLFEDGEPTEDDAADVPLVPRNYSHKLIALFSISVGIMEEQILSVIQQEFVSSEYSDTDDARNFFERRKFRENLKLAYELGIIGEGTKGKIEDVYNTRNALVHDPTERLTVENVISHKDRISKAASAPEDLDKILSD
jgi:ribonuclease HI